MRVDKRYFVPFGLLISSIFYATDLYACICTRPTFEEEIRYSDEIFIGDISRVERYELGRIKDRYGSEEVFWGWRYYFDVKKKWKGNDQSEFIIENTGSGCSLSFDIYPQNILVYGIRTSEIEMYSKDSTSIENGIEVLHTSICSRTTHKGNESRNWYEKDLGKLNRMFSDKIKLNAIGENKEKLYLHYVGKRKSIRLIIFFIVLLVLLNIFQFIRAIR
ncbi:hypothetical protein [Lewinella sp. LCG006]|uniref:hypothetical protein n=1 Tax=Lewinella sp. LCG006 TaxID=3231911 RepID=UPI00345F3F1D